jgi:hypothetical protein
MVVMFFIIAQNFVIVVYYSQLDMPIEHKLKSIFPEQQISSTEQQPTLEQVESRPASSPTETAQREMQVPSVPVFTAPQMTSATYERYRQIEHVLEEDLGDIFHSLNHTDQQLFKQRGEQTAASITRLLEKPKVSAKKIVALIRRWLRFIPGINQFFLEQEAKIKADKIISLYHDLPR